MERDGGGSMPPVNTIQSYGHQRQSQAHGRRLSAPFSFLRGDRFLSSSCSLCLSLSRCLSCCHEQDLTAKKINQSLMQHPSGMTIQPTEEKKNINIRSHPSIRPSCPETVYLARVYCVRPPPRKHGARVTDFFLPRPELGCL